jgi:hypothetical protein
MNENKGMIFGLVFIIAMVLGPCMLFFYYSAFPAEANYNIPFLFWLNAIGWGIMAAYSFYKLIRYMYGK